MTLTPQQVLHFRQLGYLRLPTRLQDHLLNDLHEYVRALHDQDGTPKSYRLYERDTFLMTRLITHAGLGSDLESLLGPNIVYVANRHNQSALNLPHVSDTRLHRDVLQWTRNVLTCVAYLEDSTDANGCTRIIPGSHLLPFVGVPQPDGGGTWMGEHEEFEDMLDQAVPVPMRRGQVLAFDGLVFHAAGENTSARSRASLVLGFRSADELEYAPDPVRQVVVRGSQLYRGNDRNHRRVPRDKLM